MTRSSRRRGGFLAGLSLAILCGLAGPAWPRCTVGMIANLPVTVEDLRPKIHAQINGVDATFLIDSGAFYSIITPASAKEFHLQTQMAPPGFYLIGIGGDASASLATVRNFTIGKATLPYTEFIVGGSEVGNDGGGLIGQNFLGIADVEYDLAGGAVRLMRPRDCGNVAFAYWAKDGAFSTIDIEPMSQGLDRKTVGYVYINGVRLRALFDTGAGTTLIWRRAAKRAGIDVNGAGVNAGYMGSGLGRGHFTTWVAPVDDVKIGDEEIRHTQMVVADTSLDSAGLSEAPDMLIGADFFLSHRVYVANGQHKLYFTYNGGPVFNLKAPQATSPAAAEPPPPPASPSPAGASTLASLVDETPTDADGFARRGVARASRREFAAAIADLTRAVDLAPAEPRYLFERARAYVETHQPSLARADLDRGLAMAPRAFDERVLRAEIRLAQRDTSGALADAGAADLAAPKEADVRFVLGRLYGAAGEPKASVAQFDTWIRNHPDDSKRPMALNGRCWNRALLNEDLDQALADCDAAIRGLAKSAAPFDSRGLVYLRRGEFEKAISDYDAALVLNPKLAWSLYGRGLAEIRSGAAAKGNADIAAGAALDPGLPARAKALGLVP